MTHIVETMNLSDLTKPVAVSRTPSLVFRSTLILIGVTGSLLLSGCGRKEQTPADMSRPTPQAAVSIDSQPAQTDAAATPAPASATPVEVVSTDSAPSGKSDEQVVEELQAALQAYYLANVNSADRFTAPKSLDELVKRGLIKKIPAPSPGKKFVYHPENWQVTIETAGTP